MIKYDGSFYILIELSEKKSSKRALKSVRRSIREAKSAQAVLDQKRTAMERIQLGAGGPQDYRKFHTPLGIKKRALKKKGEKKSEELTVIDFLVYLFLIAFIIVLIYRML